MKVKINKDQEKLKPQMGYYMKHIFKSNIYIYIYIYIERERERERERAE